jgi:hypothetical protein
LPGGTPGRGRRGVLMPTSQCGTGGNAAYHSPVSSGVKLFLWRNSSVAPRGGCRDATAGVVQPATRILQRQRAVFAIAVSSLVPEAGTLGRTWRPRWIRP